ncbi:hypothetical protein AV530_015382 [Patagioenas fasciata monilis]|uniref:Uncharacterized protein n=1 Tax=Patagioenas fasciata monilis TaxID=372326 RepID=A0A1V4JV69_PATFA|nr:hypothetical protein AV530_015382 [Patagioenas fasciata monilis]
MAPLVTACVLPTVPGLLVSSQPAQVHTIIYQLAQVSSSSAHGGSFGEVGGSARAGTRKGLGEGAEQAEDTTINDLLACLDTLEHEDAVPDVPDSPGLTAFLREFPDLSKFVAERGCTKQ